MELFRLFGTIAVDNTEANKAIDDTTNKAKNAESETSSSFSKIGSVAGSVATGIGVAGLAIGGAFIAAIEGTRDYRAEMGLLESAFETAGHSSETAKNTYSDLNAVMRDSGAAVEASQHLALVADNEDELSEMTHTLTGVYATFGKSLPLEGLSEAINHSSSLGSTQGSLADALEWSGITVEDFDAQLALCSDEEERQDLIMRTLKDTYSEAADQYKKTNADVMDAEKANEALTDAFADLGAVGEPILTKIKEKVAEMVSVAAPKLQEFIDKIKDCITWVKENEQTIQTWVGIILGATAAVGTFLLILNWGSIMAAASKAINAVRSAVLLFNAALIANPIGIIVALIVGLVATFIYLWNNVDGFKKFWVDAWDLIQKKAGQAKDWIVKTWNNIGTWFKEKFEIVRKAGQEVMDKVRKFFSDAWSGIQKIWSACVKFFQDVWSGIVKVFSVVGTWISNQFKNAWNLSKSIWGAAFGFFSSIWSGIKNVFSSVASFFGNAFRQAWSNIKSAFSSWSSFFGNLWSNITGKFTEIGTKIGNSVGSAVKKGINGVIGGAESLINGFIGQINGAIKWINKIPGVDITKIAKVNFTRLAEGGVLKAGQVGLLEGSGAEAVVPLEKNTQWIDRVAERFGTNMETQDNTKLISLMEKVLKLMEQMVRQNIYLDSGALVGELAPEIDSALGTRYKHIQRGNTR